MLITITPKSVLVEAEEEADMEIQKNVLVIIMAVEIIRVITIIKKKNWRKSETSSTSSKSYYKVKWKKGSFDWSKISETLDLPQFCKALTTLLDEPNERLIYHIVEKTTKELALSILKETEKVQDEGGLEIEYGQYKRKKRTTGGVFIKLLRDKIPKEKWEEINQVNREDPLNANNHRYNHNHNHNHNHNRKSNQMSKENDEDDGKNERRKRYRPKARVLEQRKPSLQSTETSNTEENDLMKEDGEAEENDSEIKNIEQEQDDLQPSPQQQPEQPTDTEKQEQQQEKREQDEQNDVVPMEITPSDPNVPSVSILDEVLGGSDKGDESQ